MDNQPLIRSRCIAAYIGVAILTSVAVGVDTRSKLCINSISFNVPITLTTDVSPTAKAKEYRRTSRVATDRIASYSAEMAHYSHLSIGCPKRDCQLGSFPLVLPPLGLFPAAVLQPSAARDTPATHTSHAAALQPEGTD